MDEFVCNKLTEWGLSDWIERFKDELIDEESLYSLHDHQDIDNLISKAGPRAKFKKKLQLLQGIKEEQKTTSLETAECQQNAEEAADPPQACSSTSETRVKGKRKSDFPGGCSQLQSTPTKRPHVPNPRSYSEEITLNKVKNIMSCVDTRIPNQDNEKLNKFLKDKINNLETDKRELVGVFGRTGAGKSSLINAVIEEKDLLPSGSVTACTSVMIKVEANMLNGKYVADIEFISKEEWKDELWSLFNFLGDNADQEKDQQGDDDYRETDEKLSALYGEEWKNITKSHECLMDSKYFREIPEFLNSRKKTLTCDSAKELSARVVKYTRTDTNDKGKDVKRWYWPLVKCVTIRVPNNDLLKYVTLVDLPGYGDRNKSRDKMWKKFVGSCSTVWIVTDIIRAASEKEPWEILESARSLIGNGGECQNIHFICTKSDQIYSDADPEAVRDEILKRNIRAKEEVKKEYKFKKIKKDFSDDHFQVFTVSSKEFLKKKHPNPEETEIPKLQKCLQNLNDRHSETFNYVSGAHGILSLIQGARCREVVAHEMDLCAVLEENLKRELDKVRKPMEEAHEAFVKCLSEGVEKSRKSCEKVLTSFLYPRGVTGRSFHRSLKYVVENNGTYKPKKVNLNVKLASCLTESIDEDFRKTFPNEGNSGPYNGVINTFSLDTVKLIEKHKNVELQLIFLKTEEEKIRTLLHKDIRERKKTIYCSLTTTIEEFMHKCYEKAARFRGNDSLKNMRITIETHVHESEEIMFEQAKNIMLNQLRDLKEDTLKKLEETMQESIKLSLKTDGHSIPDVTVELEQVKRYYYQLLGTHLI